MRGLAFSAVAGERFGRLSVVAKARDLTTMKPEWLCVCDCGGLAFSQGSYLRSGHVKSCGCLQRELRERGVAPTHGHARQAARTGTYIAWKSMKQRCVNSKRQDWKNYGGRGISVCAKWRTSFPAFLADMGERPIGLEIDRIDNDGNYEPGNCRWTTRLVNRRNRHRRVQRPTSKKEAD